MDFIQALARFVFTVLAATFGQLVWLFGLIFVFGFLLYIVAKMTRTVGVQCAGQRWDVVVTGWCGTPVHELGHAAFCLLFRHRVTAIKLYDPNPEDGSLGYVRHTFDQRSIYQKVGNFFIGIGPILFGALVLYVLLLLLLPEWGDILPGARGGATDLRGVGGWTGIVQLIAESVACVLKRFFSFDNLLNWRFWVFLYLSFCIASHIELSPPDIRGAKDGLVSLVLLFLVVNFFLTLAEATGLHSALGGFWKYLKLETYGGAVNTALATLGALLAYALVISLLNFALTYAGFALWSKIRGRPLPVPLPRR
jgi:hypothetical protein